MRMYMFAPKSYANHLCPVAAVGATTLMIGIRLKQRPRLDTVSDRLQPHFKRLSYCPALRRHALVGRYMTRRMQHNPPVRASPRLQRVAVGS